MASLAVLQMLWRVSAYFLLKAYLLIAFQCLRNSVDGFDGFLPVQHLFWGGMLFTDKVLQLFVLINCWTSDLWLEGRCIHRGLWLVLSDADTVECPYRRHMNGRSRRWLLVGVAWSAWSELKKETLLLNDASAFLKISVMTSGQSAIQDLQSWQCVLRGLARFDRL